MADHAVADRDRPKEVPTAAGVDAWSDDLTVTRWRAARPMAVLAIVLLAAFAAMLVVVSRSTDPPRVDTAVLAWFAHRRTPTLTAFFRVVTTIGSPVGVALTTALGVAAMCLRRRSAWPLLLGAVALSGAQLIGSALKVLVGRARPPLLDRVPDVSARGLDFPSGHSTQSAAAYLVLALLVAEGIRTRRGRALLYAAAGVSVLLVGTSRLYLGVHWFTDVTASWCLGLGWTCAVVAGVSGWSDRSFAGGPRSQRRDPG